MDDQCIVLLEKVITENMRLRSNGSARIRVAKDASGPVIQNGGQL